MKSSNDHVEKHLVEEFTEKDAEELALLFQKVWPRSLEYPEGWRKKRSYSVEQILVEMREGYHFFGIRIGNKISGVYKAVIRGSDCFGEQQTVDPDYAGHGLARVMYSQFIKFAREQGCKRNVVNILVGQKTGERFMKLYGFKKHGLPYEQYPGMLVQKYYRSIV